MLGRSLIDRYGPWVLVTGAAEGLGAGFSRVLAAQGFGVVLVDIQREAAERLAAELEREHAVPTRVLIEDLTSLDFIPHVRALAEELEIGLLVSNAGVSMMGPLLDMELEAQLRCVELNCRASLAMVHLLATPMRARGRGGVIFISSNSALMRTPLLANYVATKAYNLALAEALWEELRPEGIDVLGLLPGIIRTGAVESLQPRWENARGLVMEPEEVAKRGLAALGRSPSFIPGASDRFGAFLLGRLLPRRLSLPLARRALVRIFPGATGDRE